MLTPLLLMIILLVAASIILLTTVFVPSAEDRLKIWKTKKEKVIEKEMDNMFYYDRSPNYIVRLYFILPPIFSIFGFVLFKSGLFLFIGALLGLFIPNVILKIRNIKRRHKFNAQILDAIMILSSALKGGLSLLQSIEVLMTEMPAPMSQEMGLVIRENKVGITLDESLKRLNKRMNMEDLALVVNSILVARETGGDLTKVLSRLTTTIRDNRKLKENIKTLTLQGKLQGIIMSVIPIVFVWWVVLHNRHHFDIMLKSDLGRMLLVIAVALQLIGMFLIRKFSIIRI